MYFMKNIEQQSTLLKKVASQVLELTNHRIEETAVSIIKTTGITISTRYEAVENIEFNDNELLEVSVFLQQKKGISFSNNLDNNAVINTVNTAINIARYTSLDIYSGIADKNLLAFSPKCLNLCHPIDLSIQLGSQLASQAEKTALKYDKRIVCTEGATFSSYITIIVVGNSHGMLNAYSKSQYSLSCNVIAESNGVMEQNYSYTLSRLFNNLQSPEWVGQECAKKALRQLNAKKIKTMESSVLFVAELATSLFKHLSNAINGNNIYRKSTFLLHDLGKKIFPSWVSIKELPHISQELGSAPFDNEGVRTLNRLIIKDGVLNNWLLDTYSARKIGLKSTGNFGKYIYNWYVNCQNISFLELIKTMDRGLIITNLMGQGVNIMTGDYSRGASGLWVENGEIQYPVNEITISGNLKKMFLNITAIGNDIETRSNIRCGSVLIDSMQIAGI